MGRRSTFTQATADEICRRLADGETLRAICRDEGMPAESAVRNWALSDVQGFSAQYARAREIGYHGMADELIEIADDARNDWMEQNADGSVAWVENGEALQRSRLRVDTRKWMLSKVLPKVYGDKLQHAGPGPNGEHEVIHKITREIVAPKPHD